MEPLCISAIGINSPGKRNMLVVVVANKKYIISII